MSGPTEDQKQTVEILRAQGETEDRIAAYLGTSVPKKPATKPKPDES